MKKISAATIGEETAQHGFVRDAQKELPSSEDMIKDIRARLESRIENLEKSAAVSKLKRPNGPPSAFELSLKSARKDLQKFEQLVGNVPKGFALAPVLYSKIEYEQNRKVQKEFYRKVRKPFLKYLAENHTQALQDLGICQDGIDRMKRGLDPCDENGHLYDVSVDHIIERSGGGNLSQNMVLDGLNPDNCDATYMVNHFDNLILLPEQVHKAKNMLNELQDTVGTRQGDSKWVLMLIPETGPKQEGYVAQPQDKGHYLAGVRLRPMAVSQLISHASFSVDQANEQLDVFCAIPAIASALKADKGSLSQIFNAAVAADPARQGKLDNFVRPAIEDAGKFLKKCFSMASKPGASEKDYHSFVRLFQGQAVRTLYQAAQCLPVQEADDFHQTWQDISDALKMRRTSKKGRDGRSKKP